MSETKEKLECGDLMDNGEYYICCLDECQVCCPHDERDHGICLCCGHEQCPGELIDAAEYYLDPER